MWRILRRIGAVVKKFWSSFREAMPSMANSFPFRRESGRELSIRPKVQRYALFWMALALVFGPAIVGCFLYDCDLQSAISSYYHTRSHDLFVGLLFAISFFLFSYRGRAPFDNFWSTVTALSAIGIGVLPPNPTKVTDECYVCVTPLIDVPHIYHLLATAIFAFLMFFLVLRFAFEAKWRLVVRVYYLFMAAVMFVGGMYLLSIFLNVIDGGKHGILFGEAIIILSFAAAWLMKAKQTDEDLNS